MCIETLREIISAGLTFEIIKSDDLRSYYMKANPNKIILENL